MRNTNIYPLETKDKLKRILIEGSELKTSGFYHRDFDLTLLDSPEILSVIGARRTGKTFLCYQMIENLKKKTPLTNIIYFNLEDERLHPLSKDVLTTFWDIALELFPIDFNHRIYLFIDEIQNAPNWSKWARRITEQNRNIKLVITGSSSKLLSQEISTELRGRTLSFTIYPLSFREYLRAKKIPVEITEHLLHSSKQSALIKRQFNHYLKEGGFPATLQTNHPQELLTEYFKVMFYRDLVERFKIKNIQLFEDYLTLMIDQIACHFSISATAEKLHSFGYSLSKNTLSNFSRYAEDAFLVFEVKKYSFRIREQLRATRKVYAIDSGLTQAIRFSFLENYGRMLENIVFLSLKRQKADIYYHKGSKECDFLVTQNKKIIKAIQVCKSLINPDTKKRELDGLTEALSTHHLQEGIILTEDESNSFKVDKKVIRVFPVWYWLLKNN